VASVPLSDQRSQDHELLDRCVLDVRSMRSKHASQDETLPSSCHVREREREERNAGKGTGLTDRDSVIGRDSWFEFFVPGDFLGGVSYTGAI